MAHFLPIIHPILSLYLYIDPYIASHYLYSEPYHSASTRSTNPYAVPYKVPTMTLSLPLYRIVCNTYTESKVPIVPPITIILRTL